MHAVVVRVTFNDREEAHRALEAQVIPQSSGADGFIAGYWIAEPGDTGTAVLALESEDAAQSFANEIPRVPGGGVTPTEVTVGEVIGHA